MELKLNIYNGAEIEKTYKTDQYDILFGTVEDIVMLIDADAFADDAKEMDVAGAVMKFVSGGIEEVRELLKEVFPGLTDGELRRTKMKEVVKVLIDLAKYSFKSMGEMAGKN